MGEEGIKIKKVFELVIFVAFAYCIISTFGEGKLPNPMNFDSNSNGYVLQNVDVMPVHADKTEEKGGNTK